MGLKGRDHLFESAFKHSSIGMALVGTNGSWLDVNDSLCAIIGYTKDELQNLTFQDITHPEDLEKDLSALNECLNLKRSCYVIEKRYIHKNGEVVWILLTVSAIVEDGAVQFFISQVQDITENKKNHKRLVDASKMAALGEMAAGIAHEINNPLTVIGGNSSILKVNLPKLGVTDLDVYSRLDRINSTVKRISAIIEGMKNFSRKGKQPVEDSSLEEIISETLNLCREKLISSAVDISIKIEDSLFVNCNKLELGQVLLNLISNAHHALEDQDRKKITIHARSNKGLVEISFSDNGPGIAKDIQKKVMKPFFTTKPIGQGTGLGLSLSKEMIERMGGSIKLVDSDEGATFLISLRPAQNKDQKAA